MRWRFSVCLGTALGLVACSSESVTSSDSQPDAQADSGAAEVAADSSQADSSSPTDSAVSIDSEHSDVVADSSAMSDSDAFDSDASDSDASDSDDSDVVADSSPEASPSMCVDAGAGGSSACNGLTLTGPPVVTTMSASGSPKGGTIVDGTYVLTALGGAASSSSYRQRLSICGSSMQVVKEVVGSPPTTATMTFTLSGTTITLTASCGTYWDGSNGYDATPTTLTIYGGGYDKLSFTRE